VNKEEALQYLKLWKIDEKQAAQIYDFVGGRMIHLQSFADEIKRNRTFEGMCSMLYRKRLGSYCCEYAALRWLFAGS
jgi:hypothetical protein